MGAKPGLKRKADVFAKMRRLVELIEDEDFDRNDLAYLLARVQREMDRRGLSAVVRMTGHAEEVGLASYPKPGE